MPWAPPSGSQPFVTGFGGAGHGPETVAGIPCETSEDRARALQEVVGVAVIARALTSMRAYPGRSIRLWPGAHTRRDVEGVFEVPFGCHWRPIVAATPSTRGDRTPPREEIPSHRGRADVRCAVASKPFRCAQVDKVQ